MLHALANGVSCSLKPGRIFRRLFCRKDVNKGVAEMAKIYGASRSGFAAHFKSIVGVAPMDYLLKWRMAKASELLKESGRMISEVAFAVGYESETAFSTAFSRVVGISPSKYKNK